MHLSSPLGTLLLALAAAAPGQAPQPQAPPPAPQAAAAAPAPASRADLRALLQPIREAHRLPALGAAIVRDGRVTGLGVVGLRAVGRPDEVGETDKWHLGSCGKAMTATVLARLVERDVLDWSTTLGEILAPRIASMHAGWKPVTLLQLLSHRAGFAKEIDPAIWARLQERKGSPTEQRLLLAELMLASAPRAAPGSKHEYSNTGYALAGLMAELKTGKAWEELVAKELFEPLGMRDAGFGAPTTTPGKLDQPLGHRDLGGLNAIAPGPWADNPPAIAPAGTIHASLEGWARFIALHLGTQPEGAEPYLKPETLTFLHTALPDQSYALGWGVLERKWAKGLALSHAGSNTMWYCVAWLAPERNFAVLVVTNTAGGDVPKACDDAAAALIRYEQL